jgi:hypothetical protein
MAATGAIAVTPTAQAEVPPAAYSNGIRLSTTHVPIIATGRFEVHGAGGGFGKFDCTNTFWGEGWNAHENNEATKPERAYGDVLGWASRCSAPEYLNSLETNERFIRENHVPLPLTIFASPEMPAEETFRQGEICKEEKKPLSQCPLAGERETKLLVSAYHRRASSFPWKVELIRGVREAENGILAKIGLAEFGEAGTAESQTTKCYPKEGTNPASFEKVPPGCIAFDIIVPQVPYEYVFYGTQESWSVNGAGNGLDASRLEWPAPAGTFFSSKGALGELSVTALVRLSGSPSLQLMTAR